MLKTVEKFINEQVDLLPDNAVFTARRLSEQYEFYARLHEAQTGEKPNVYRPYDDTVGRMLRRRRAWRNDVHYWDRSRALWWKSDHDATIEERKGYGNNRY